MSSGNRAKRLAQDMASRDIRNAIQSLPPGAEVVFSDDDELAHKAIPPDTTIILSIGRRGALSKRYADEYAKTWKDILARSPQTVIVIHISGYDEDPREIWEFPDVRKYVRRWARSAGFSNDLDTAARQLGVGEDGLRPDLSVTLALLAICGVFGAEAAAKVQITSPRTTTH